MNCHKELDFHFYVFIIFYRQRRLFIHFIISIPDYISRFLLLLFLSYIVNSHLIVLF